MGAYGVQSVGIVGNPGLSSTGKFYQAANAGVCAGHAAGFSCFLALQTLEANSTTHYLAGTLDAGGVTGWAIRRVADSLSGPEFEVVLALTPLVTLAVPFSLPSLGRSLLLGFTYDGTTGLNVYANGSLVASEVGVAPYVPSVAAFGLGNAPVAGADGSVDRIISFGYTNTVLSALRHGDMWNNFRDTSSLQYAGESDAIGGFAYCYEAADLAMPPTITRPTTWRNSGTVLTGDLTWTGVAADEVRFTVDADPDYASLAVDVPGAVALPPQYSMFYGLTAGTGNGGASDYAATVAVKTVAGSGRVPFPRLGPTLGANAPTLSGGNSAIIPEIGDYEVTFRCHTTEPGQLQLELQGADLAETCMGNMNPTAGGHEISGTFIVRTTVVNSVLAVINPTGNAAALTITPADGSNTHANAQVFTIKRIG